MRLLIASITLLLTAMVLPAGAQDSTDLLKGVTSNAPEREYVTSAFKSSRVINGHSMEFIGKGVLDVRILHRFGYVNEGAYTLFGLDEASMRLGFDYGLGNNFTIGIGRSTYKKEVDGFLKYRILRQSTGPRSSPVSIVLVSGMTIDGLKWAYPDRKNYFSSRMGFYNELIIGRKFSELFSLQIAPVFVHRNLVDSVSKSNDTWALGIGGRMKLTKRLALVLDYHPVLSEKDPGTFDPLSIGIDIETGGHVFQLHFSNSSGMNEKEFITNTTGDFWKGEIRFGFNLSRVFNVAKSARKG